MSKQVNINIGLSKNVKLVRLNIKITVTSRQINTFENKFLIYNKNKLLISIVSIELELQACLRVKRTLKLRGRGDETAEHTCRQPLQQ